jgi:hypothetical protein
MFNALNRPGSASAALPAIAAAGGENSSDVILVNRIAAGDKQPTALRVARRSRLG